MSCLQSKNTLISHIPDNQYFIKYTHSLACRFSSKLRTSLQRNGRDGAQIRFAAENRPISVDFVPRNGRRDCHIRFAEGYTKKTDAPYRYIGQSIMSGNLSQSKL